MLWLLRLSTFVNALGVLFVYVMIHVVSESHWIGVVLTYFPRMLYPVPAFVLALVSWRWSRYLAIGNLFLLWLALGPIMDFRYGGLFVDGDAEKGSLKILSCNVQRYSPDFTDVLREIDSLDPDIVAFQESKLNYPPQIEYFSKKPWHQAGFHQFRIFSKFPIKELPNTGIFTGYSRWPMFCVAGFEIETDNGSFYLFNIHQATPRHELSDLSLQMMWSGDTARQIEAKHRYRDKESRMFREYIDKLRGDRPFVVMGDFNTPSSSSLFRSHWGDLQNAFDQCGFGYGYTANCETESHWPKGLPWARVDHILGSKECRFERCITGSSNGSDHRLIMAWMKLADDKK
ncbi:MAG: endonuclease/exonuclease/phosphatase family protein [Planctomycetaceae bacterium]